MKDADTKLKLWADFKCLQYSVNLTQAIFGKLNLLRKHLGKAADTDIYMGSHKYTTVFVYTGERNVRGEKSTQLFACVL